MNKKWLFALVMRLILIAAALLLLVSMTTAEQMFLAKIGMLALATITFDAVTGWSRPKQ